MKKIDGLNLKRAVTPDDIMSAEGAKISFCACVNKIKSSGGFYFVLLRTGRYVFQSVYHPGRCEGDFDNLCEGAYVSVSGKVKKEERAPYGYEITLSSFKILSKPKEASPLPFGSQHADWSVESGMEHRLAALRHSEERAVFKINEGVTSAFCSFMLKNGFTEIHTPKITSMKPEGGRNIFKLKYFGENAYLAQSPQLYKQACTAVFDRVFEVGSSYRAEKHNSTRHLNEFVSLDFEMAYIDNIHEVMSVLAAAVKYIIKYLGEHYGHELDLLGAILPQAEDIPCITFYEAMDILGKSRSQPDLDPTDEVKLCGWAKENYNSLFLFVEKLPSKKRPFYNMDTEGDTHLSETFELLLGGMEIASGGQRIHDYDEQILKLERMGLNSGDFAAFLENHKYGMPPHGGAGMGLERLVMKLLNLDNIRRASLFPRDLHHLKP